MNTLSPNYLQWIKGCIGTDFTITKHSFSHQADAFVVQTNEIRYYAKVADDLRSEYDNTIKLQNYLSVPQMLDFAHIDGRDCILMTELPGKNLAELRNEWQTVDLVREFARAVRQFHALPGADIFATAVPRGWVVLHGDMAMPNILCIQPNQRGFIDLGQVRLGTPDEDLADGLWSVQRNLGPGYGELFLESYGDVTMTDRLEKALAFRFKEESL